MRRVFGSWLLALFACSALAIGETGLPVLGGGAPDIQADIMQMFEQGRRDGRAEVILDSDGQPLEDPARVEMPAQEDLFHQYREQEQARQQSDGETAPPPPAEPPIAPAAQPAARPQAPPRPRDPNGPLQLPAIEITIQSPEDLERLQQKFDEARERQNGPPQPDNP